MAVSRIKIYLVSCRNRRLAGVHFRLQKQRCQEAGFRCGA